MSVSQEDRYRDLYREMEQDLPDHPEQWSQEQRVFLFPNWFINEMNNGGAAQAIVNTSGSYLPEMRDVLSDLSLDPEAELVDEMIRFFNWHLCAVLVHRFARNSAFMSRNPYKRGVLRWIDRRAYRWIVFCSERRGFDDRFSAGMEAKIVRRLLERFGVS